MLLEMRAQAGGDRLAQRRFSIAAIRTDHHPAWILAATVDRDGYLGVRRIALRRGGTDHFERRILSARDVGGDPLDFGQFQSHLTTSHSDCPPPAQAIN